LQRIADLAAAVAGARYGALGVVGPDGRIQEFFTSGITEEQRKRIGKRPEGHGLLGVLIEEARPLRLRRIQDHPRSIGFPNEHHPSMSTFLGVPIAIRGRVFGNLYLTEKQGAEEFTQEDEEAVIWLAAHAAVAVENARLYNEAQLGQRRLSAMNAVARAILENQPLEDVLRLIVRHARELLEAGVVTLAMPHEAPGQVVVRVAEGDHADEFEGMTFPAAHSVSGDVMRSGTAVRIDDASNDPRVHQPLVGRGNIGPALFVPLAVRGRVFGTLGFGNVPGLRFSDSDLDVAEAFASQAGVALEHARLQNELQRLVLVEDRERIAKELHDDIIQSLFAEGMALQASLSLNHEGMSARVVQAVEHIDRVIRDLRGYIFALRPGGPADRVLDQALVDLAADFAEGSRIDIDVHVEDGLSGRLASRVGELIQMTREAISNAVRHSGGDHVRVTLASSDSVAVLEVADNGKGFTPDEARGSGLVNLEARAAALGGDLDLESEPGRGTWVRIRFPI
jgi:signal transduction histidine kinase